MTSFVFPLDFDSHGEVELLELEASALRREPFHDGRMRGRYRAAGRLPLAELERREQGAATEAPRYIFHHGFALSTLLSRWLDQPGHTFVLREPAILTRLSELQLRDPAGFASPRGRGILAAVIRLLCRTESPRELPLIKGCDSLTGIIGPLLDLDRDARGVLLYTDFATFVTSCLKDTGRHVWARDRTRLFDAWDACEAEHLPAPRSAAEASARLWYQQLRAYARLLQSHPHRLMPLYAERLLAEPAQTLRQVGEHLTLDLPPRPLPEPHLHAKTGRRFDAAQRAQEQIELARVFAAELSEARAWLVAAGSGNELIAADISTAL